MGNRERRVTVTPRIVGRVIRFVQDPVQHEETNGAIRSEGGRGDYDIIITIQNPRQGKNFTKSTTRKDWVTLLGVFL